MFSKYFSVNKRGSRKIYLLLQKSSFRVNKMFQSCRKLKLKLKWWLHDDECCTLVVCVCNRSPIPLQKQYIKQLHINWKILAYSQICGRLEMSTIFLNLIKLSIVLLRQASLYHRRQINVCKTQAAKQTLCSFLLWPKIHTVKK